MDRAEVVTVYAGSVEYSVDEAAASIDDLIDLLENAKEEGATHVVFLSGNYRGAQYLRVDNSYDWLEDA